MPAPKTLPEMRTVREYVARHVSPMLQESTTPKFNLPEYGTKSEVYLLHWHDKKGAVLRVFESAKEHRRFERAMRSAIRNGAPVPQLLRSDGGWLTRMRYRSCFAVEEFITGQLLADRQVLDHGAEERVLDSLAALHDITSDRWGHLDNLKDRDHAPDILRHTKAIFDDVPSNHHELHAGEKAHWFDKMMALWAKLPPVSQFSLIHRHLAPDDIILPAAGTRAVFLDNIGHKYGHWAYDLEDVLSFLAHDDDAKRHAVIKAYLGRRKTLPPGTDYMSEETYFRAEWHVKKLRSVWRAQAGGRHLEAEKTARHIHMIRRLLH